MTTLSLNFSDALSPDTKLQNGHFTIGKILGQGGFGITYYGQDERLHRPVAIKEFFPQGAVRYGNSIEPSKALPSADYKKSKTQFIDEARVLAQFRHPGIVQVYTFFEENNTAYMVMEYLDGMTLAQWVEKSGPLSDPAALMAIELVSEALQAVHQAGVLHRDVKPENIMACGDTTSRAVRLVLIDFGLNKKLGNL